MNFAEFIRKHTLLVLIFLISFLPLTIFFITPDLIHTHDGLVHLPRIAAYFKAFTDGQILPRWAGDLNYGYGMPLFNFIYHVPYLVSSFFIFLGFGLVSSFKLSLSISYLLAGIFMFLFAKQIFKDEKKAFIVALLYQFAPFHLVELLVRGSFGEVYTYAFLPLVLFAIILLNKKKTIFNLLLLSFATFLLIISHNAISLVFFGISALFALIFSSKKNLAVVILGLFLGLSLSAFYWVPALLEHKYTYGDLYMKDLYRSHFAPILYFFVPNIFKSKAYEIGAVSVQFGFFHILAIVFSVFCFRTIKEKEFKKLIIFSISIICIALFFMQPVSLFLWEKISFLRQFQFPWRFLAVVVFSTSVLGAFFLDFKIFLKKEIYFILCVLIVASTVFYWKPAEGLDKVNEAYYWNFPLNTTYYGETDVIWAAGAFRKYPKTNVEIIAGKASISDYKKKSNLHTYKIFAETESRIVDHTQYFPGWKVYVNEKPVLIEFQDQNWRGEITYSVLPGISNVEVKFGESPVRLLADIVSVVAIFFCAGLVIKKGIKKTS